MSDGSGSGRDGAGGGGTLFAAVFLALSLLLTSQLGGQAKFSGAGALFAQPAFWPGVGVVGMSVFGAIHLWSRWRGTDWAAELRAGVSWLRAGEYLLWFMAYVFAAPVVGYLAATVAFMVLLALRSGYRTGRALLAAALVGVAIVAVFKAGLGVRIPGGAAYELLPGGLRTFMIVNF